MKKRGVQKAKMWTRTIRLENITSKDKMKLENNLRVYKLKNE